MPTSIKIDVGNRQAEKNPRRIGVGAMRALTTMVFFSVSPKKFGFQSPVIAVRRESESSGPRKNLFKKSSSCLISSKIQSRGRRDFWFEEFFLLPFSFSSRDRFEQQSSKIKFGRKKKKNLRVFWFEKKNFCCDLRGRKKKTRFVQKKKIICT